MANETSDVTEAPAQSRPGLMSWLLIGVVCAAIGAAVPFLLPVGHGEDSMDSTTTTYSAETKSEETVYVPFEEVVVNLDEGRLTRYLRLAVTLQVSKSKEEQIQKEIEAKRAVLRNWLINSISDKTLDDIRGAAGQNRMRREIRDYFNTVLFPSGYDEIYDVLFDEFNVQ